MLKRWIFFLSYILIFTSVPFLVNILSTAGNVYEDANAILYDDRASSDEYEQTLDDSAGVSDSAKVAMDKQQIENTEGELLMLQDSTMLEKMSRAVFASYALLLCFIISIITTLIISVVKLIRPHYKTGGLLTGLCIYNVLYLPLFFIGALCGITTFAAYGLYIFWVYVFSGIGILFLLLVLVFIILTVLFTIMGTRKNRRLERQQIISTTPQNLPPSAHPQS